MRQLTEYEAIKISESDVWKKWSHKKRAAFQIRQELLSLPFDVFHEAVETVLDRPVMTHEFAYFQVLETVKKLTEDVEINITEIIVEV